MVDGWRQEFPYMFNYVDVRHKEAIRWLKWLGFTLNEPTPYGPFGLPFHKFHMGEE